MQAFIAIEQNLLILSSKYDQKFVRLIHDNEKKVCLICARNKKYLGIIYENLKQTWEPRIPNAIFLEINLQSKTNIHIISYNNVSITIMHSYLVLNEVTLKKYTGGCVIFIVLI